MSRIGRLPISIPDNVKLHVADGTVRVEGPKGTLTRSLEPEVSITIEGKTATIQRRDDSRRARSVHGLTRKLVANMVQGAGTGFSKVLEITGVGYRADVRGNILFMTLGYSHPIAYQLPQGISAKVERQVVITLAGGDREMLGQTAAAIRRLRPPEPY